jgi:hypothetical protein
LVRRPSDMKKEDTNTEINKIFLSLESSIFTTHHQGLKI